MVRTNEFLPNGYQKIFGAGLHAPSSTPEKDFALLDEQRAFLSDDFDYGDDPATALYHVMHEAHTCFPFEMGVAPVITQVMACMVANTMQDDGHLHIHAWDLLPAAVLLASRFPRITVSIQVGGFTKPYPAFDHQPIIALLQRLFPQAVWKTSPPEDFCHDQPVHMLGFSPFQLIRLGHLDMARISSAKMALFLVFWSALRGSRNLNTRRECIAAGLFRGIVQFSFPSGAAQTQQMAIIEMGEPCEARQGVRLARVEDTGDAESGLLADRIVDLLHGPANAGAGSMDVPIADLREENLIPENHFTICKIELNSRRLDEYAHILRCQSLRAVQHGVPRTAWGQSAKAFFARDIRQQDLDPVTGFVPPDDSVGNYVRLPEKSSPNAYDKYVLRENDIVFAFRGTIASIGGVGLVVDAGKTAIPGQIMCIIRPKSPRDAIWLYHYLRQPVIRHWVLKQNLGSGIMKTLTPSVVAKIPVHRPNPAEIASISAFHNNIVAVAWSIRQQRLSMEEQIRRIDAGFEMLNGMEE